MLAVMMASVAATIVRRFQQVQVGLFARTTLAVTSPGWLFDFPMARQNILLRPRVVTSSDTLLRVAVKIDGCFVTARRRELLALVPRGVAVCDLVVSLARCRIVWKIYGVRARARFWWATRFTMVIECRARGLRNPFHCFSSTVVRCSRRYVAPAFVNGSFFMRNFNRRKMLYFFIILKSGTYIESVFPQKSITIIYKIEFIYNLNS